MLKAERKSLFILLTVLFVLSSMLAACGNSTGKVADAKAGAIPIKIADISSNPVFRVAIHQGLFAKHGIDAQIVTFGTPAEGINSLFIKQTDIAYGADFPVLNAASKGDYSIIAATGSNTDLNASEWKLYVRDEIQKPEDLQGKKLSSLRGTFIPYLWDVFLAEHHVDIKNTTLVGQGAFDESYVALKKGEVDAVWVFGSALTSRFQGIRGVHELTDMSKTPVRIGGALIAPNSLIKEHPNAVSGFIQAIDESSAYIQAHPQEVADLLYKEVKQPKEATLKDLPKNVWEVGFTQQSVDSLSKQKKYMVEHGIIKKDFDLKTKISLDAVTSALPDRVTYQK
ncbi:NitT/TauT family transport system substrate-binding protein [Paenibacillus shirakamiensis]|uniref:NitT/TauT family transport system substrate-binding protein n=1 Tax=Paenibacillus shirakamiensis TaxID=1265935 RepID=A0ABS4JDA2_9BACL|nr:ABC transporter substrate-binding protein [Paenibacillus shirakamiensis]MBP1999650.1 NitT/TauT family transport system substrate-binding protein [Paenibacillus shirakamiensis]